MQSVHIMFLTQKWLAANFRMMRIWLELYNVFWHMHDLFSAKKGSPEVNTYQIPFEKNYILELLK